MHTAQVLEKITKSGLVITATIFKGEEKVAKTTMPYNYLPDKKKGNLSVEQVVSKALQDNNIKKRLGARISTKGQITTYELL